VGASGNGARARRGRPEFLAPGRKEPSRSSLRIPRPIRVVPSLAHGCGHRRFAPDSHPDRTSSRGSHLHRNRKKRRWSSVSPRAAREPRTDPAGRPSPFGGSLRATTRDDAAARRGPGRPRARRPMPIARRKRERPRERPCRKRPLSSLEPRRGPLPRVPNRQFDGALRLGEPLLDDVEAKLHGSRVRARASGATLYERRQKRTNHAGRTLIDPTPPEVPDVQPPSKDPLSNDWSAS